MEQLLVICYMNIQEERQYILSENNTAQRQLIDILDTLPPSTTHKLNISIPLSGEVDFSVLDSMGFNHIKSIHLAEGKITQIKHIPNSVTIFHCPKNILIKLDLPKQIKDLNVSYNHINKFEFTGIHDLVKLNCSHNELTELDELPDSIREIECEYNNITRFDLDGLNSLKVLHCSHNKLMIIQNLPPQLEDLQMDNNPMAEIEHLARGESKTAKVEAETETKVDYIEGLNEYFRLKSKYENKVNEMKKTAFKSSTNKKVGKRKASSVKPPCVNCKRPVGSIFSKHDEKYVAMCGDKDSPCNFNIQIMNGYFFNAEALLTTSKESVDDAKTSIIIQKLDTLFNYMSEARSTVLFKKELENYTEASELYKVQYDIYDQLHNNMHKKELIERKNSEIYELLENIQIMLNEYVKTQNEEILKTLVQMQKDELVPKIEFLRRLKYEIMEMHEDKHEVLHLVQNAIPLSKIDYTYSEPRRVIKFTGGTWNLTVPV